MTSKQLPLLPDDQQSKQSKMIISIYDTIKTNIHNHRTVHKTLSFFSSSINLSILRILQFRTQARMISSSITIPHKTQNRQNCAVSPSSMIVKRAYDTSFNLTMQYLTNLNHLFNQSPEGDKLIIKFISIYLCLLIFL